jgi:hypothetical protein
MAACGFPGAGGLRRGACVRGRGAGALLLLHRPAGRRCPRRHAAHPAPARPHAPPRAAWHSRVRSRLLRPPAPAPPVNTAARAFAALAQKAPPCAHPSITPNPDPPASPWTLPTQAASAQRAAPAPAPAPADKRDPDPYYGKCNARKYAVGKKNKLDTHTEFCWCARQGAPAAGLARRGGPARSSRAANSPPRQQATPTRLTTRDPPPPTCVPS